MTTDKLKPGAVADLAAHVQGRKEIARKAAMESIAALLEELRQCLGGTSLVGLPRLSMRSASGYHGVRLRIKDPAEPLPIPDGRAGWGAEALVLNADGELVVARQNDLGEVNERPAAPGDIMAEDLRAVTNGVHAALQYARQHAQRRVDVLDGIAHLADDLGNLLRGRRRT